ncbi:sensor histidine kinase [Novispirillum sp. DQ9]|uniref:sensor histidine kinase n=1 Tax=Novispirillum sp. DQ9 TaxID=3398612 RepID=UPI003C7CF139
MEARTQTGGFDAFADALPASLCLLDQAGTITWVNAQWDAFARANGYAGPTFPGLNYLAICATTEGAERGDAQTVGAGLLQVLRGQQPCFSHTYPCHGPAERRWFLLAAAPFDGGAVVLHLLAAAPAAAPEMAASRLFNRVAHEVQAPLFTMSGFAQLIADGMAGEASEAARAYARHIQEAAQHLNGVVDDMLDLAQATEKTVRLTELETPLEEMIDLARALVRPDARAGAIDILTTLECRPVLLCDPKRMIQVLVNLLSNAVKFSRAGGTVVVRTVREDGGCRVEVIDRGMGMTADDLSIALRPYGRAPAAEAAGIPGLGLGLPLARALVELHGGRLDIDSQPGQGTTVAVRLPRWRSVREA